MLSDEVVVLAFRDRVASGATLSDGSGMTDYVLNLVRPVVFTFLRDCAMIAHLRLSEVIEMRVSAEKKSVAVDVSKATRLWLIVQDANSTAIDKAAPVWAQRKPERA